MRLVLDTNVLVSANIQRSYPYYIVDRILSDDDLILCISDELFSEYVEVLNREKFARFPDFHARTQILLADIEVHSMKFTPKTRVELIADGPDNRILELAETCGADYIVTGNTNDFTMPEYKGTRIISPREFFEIINP